MHSSDTANILDNIELSHDANVVSELPPHTEETAATDMNKLHRTKTVRKLWKWNLEGMTLVVLSVIILSFAISVALIISIIIGDPQVKPRAIVSSESEHCSLYGLDLMKRYGGNAVDAAVATTLCITVARPDKASLGGCGLLLLRDRNLRDNQLFDFMCPSPSTLSPADGTKPENTVGVPGLIRGLRAVHAKFGQLRWSDLFSGAIKMASDGFQPDASLLVAASRISQADPVASMPIVSALNNLASGVYKPPVELKDVLSSLAHLGPDYFYRGDPSHATFADRLLDHMRQSGQMWTLTDLSDYVVQQPKPIQMGFAGFMLEAFPAPSSAGPYLLSLLGNLDLKNALSPLNSVALAHGDPNVTATLLHRLIELAQSSEHAVLRLGDPYDAKIAVDVLSAQSNLFSLELRKLLVSTISDVAVGTNWSPSQRVTDIGDTGILVSDSTRFTVVVNMFLGSPFGSGVVVPGTGIHLNSALRLFAKPSGPTDNVGFNVLAPGRRPLAPVSPVYISAVHQKCGVRVGLASTGGLPGALDSAQVIASSALFLRGVTCVPPSGSAPITPMGSQTTTSRSKESQEMSYAPAADYGCINPQAAIDLARIESDSQGQTAAATLYESGFPVALVRCLQAVGHVMRPFTDPPSGRVSIAGWNGYSMISSVDKRGSWSLKLF